MRAPLLAGAWLYAAAIVFVSLIPKPPDPGFAYGDKLGHFFAYGVLMFWFCYLYRNRHARLAYAIGWVLLGVGLEFAQGATATRSYELADMAANSLGVLFGWGISATLRR